MKKFVIKAFLLVFSCISLFAWFSYAATIAFNEVWYSNSCSEYTGETKYFNYYLTNGTYTTNPYDTFTASSHDAIQILKNGSTDVTYVGLWRGAWFVNGCSDWKSSSTIAKVWVPGTLVLFNNNGCTFKKPSNTYVKTSSTSIDAQIQFTIWYVSKWVSNQLTLPAWQKLYYKLPNDNLRTCYEWGNQVSDWNQCNPSPAYPISYVRQHTWECINYRIFRCGDWLLNGYNWSTNYNNWTVVEQCDPNLSWSIPVGKRCNSACQLEDDPNQQQPQCNSTYNWQTQYTDNSSTNWLNANMNLCTVWTVKPNSFDVNWTFGDVNWRHFTWQCQNWWSTVSCDAYQKWCWDGVINHAGEDCEKSSVNDWGGCNSTCELKTPTCYWNIITDPTSAQAPHNIEIYTGLINPGTTVPRWNRIVKLYFGDWNSTWNGWNPIMFPQNHYYSSAWTFTITWKIVNVYNKVKDDLDFSERPVAYCTTTVTLTEPAPTPYCWDAILQPGEQCDPGSENFWNGCNTGCQLMVPTCTLTVNPDEWEKPLTTTINGTKPNWATYKSLSYGDNTATTTNPTFPRTHTYNQIWTFDLTLTVQNNYNGQITGVSSLPTNTCTASVTTTQPGSPVPYILKQQKTWGMSNFTSNQLNVQDSWVLITYKVNFGNSWTVAATWEVRDILPPCVDYVSSTISLPAGVNANWPITETWNNQDVVRYKDFRLDPNKGWYMTVVAYIRWTWYHWTTNCANVTSYINTWYFKFVWWNTLNSQVIAVRPKLSIHKQLLTTWNLTAWSTVAYKITLTNNWSATYHNAYILDIIPSAIQYQASSIQNIINYSFEEWTTWNNEYYIKYYNFNLNAQHSVVVYLTWVLKPGFNFNETTNCAMTSGAIDCEEFPLSPVPYVQKYQKIWNDSDPSSNGWTTNLLTVELRQFISYRIDFWNIWNKPATGEVKDILPKCVEYIGANLVGASWNWPTYYPNTRTVQFTNIPLAAWQTAHMMVVWKIKEGDGCTGTYRYLNTWSFHFMNTPWQNSTVLAERPNTTDVEITKEVSPTGTVQQWDLVTYTINYRNKWPEVLQSYTILDYWPADKLNFSGVVYTNPNPSSYTRVWDNIIKRVFNTPLGVGQTWQIIIQWVVK